MRLHTDLPFTCVTCEMEIAAAPVFHVGLPFCCAGCVANGPCTCSYDPVPQRVTEKRVAPAAAHGPVEPIARPAAASPAVPAETPATRRQAQPVAAVAAR